MHRVKSLSTELEIVEIETVLLSREASYTQLKLGVNERDCICWLISAQPCEEGNSRLVYANGREAVTRCRCHYNHAKQ